ncbi:MAG: hypothetical protein WA180_12830, partial [Candidatus Sulfotelmatobacter sp.]
SLARHQALALAMLGQNNQSNLPMELSSHHAKKYFDDDRHPPHQTQKEIQPSAAPFLAARKITSVQAKPLVEYWPPHWFSLPDIITLAT